MVYLLDFTKRKLKHEGFLGYEATGYFKLFDFFYDHGLGEPLRREKKR